MPSICSVYLLYHTEDTGSPSKKSLNVQNEREAQWPFEQCLLGLRLSYAPGDFRLLILMANTVKKMLYQHEDLLKE